MIIPSFLQKLPWSVKKYRSYLPLYPLAIEQFDLREYNVILSSSFIVAKGLLTNTDQLHICYMHNPIRPAWELYQQFLSHGSNGKRIKGFFSRLILHYLRLWDVTSANRVDHYIANSKFTAERIKKIYNKDATVIYPPVDIEIFKLQEIKEDYYVTASRLVYHKRIDIIVEAFNRMPDKKLVIVGDGPELKNLQKLAHSNITFVKHQPNDGLIKYLQNARAFVFAAYEDFGIAPIEAMACGTPVLAFGKGGSTETVINNKTGLLFSEQNAASICNCVLQFENVSHLFNPKSISLYAEKFSKERFEKEYKLFVDNKVKAFFKAEDDYSNNAENQLSATPLQDFLQ
ncbi:MAG: glycosyltransferase [Mucilaginibacter sp.]|nr:glycosyltransferase [Mucilaginibacter sp.]